MNKYALVGVVLATNLMYGSEMNERSKVLKDGQELHIEAAGQGFFGLVATVIGVNLLPSRIASKVPGFVSQDLVRTSKTVASYSFSSSGPAKGFVETSKKNISRKLPKKAVALFAGAEIGAHLWQARKFKNVEEQLYNPNLTLVDKEQVFKDTEANYPIAFEHRDVKLKSKIMINSNASNKLLFPFFSIKQWAFSKFAVNQSK
ncbi:hypothetical protein IPH25_01615 [bacterium]|nr:MAG: hypothetical protein IPG37_03745 [bacterium]QQR62124.1 MAG: hypothetical protein IPH25_01615 [bacterium]QQR63318.1 MAG: hypothetical protein IPH67_02495 [bacterium]